MKSKETKKYAKLCSDYLSSRRSCELHSNNIKWNEEKLRKAEEAFEALETKDENVKIWYDFYISALKFIINSARELLDSYTKERKVFEAILINEYEEDVKALYLAYKKKWNL